MDGNDANKIFGHIGRAAGILAATAAIGGTAGYSCFLGVALGVFSLKQFEGAAGDHVDAARAILEKAGDTPARVPEAEPLKKTPEPEPQTPKPAARQSSRGSGPEMTAQNEPRTFAAAPQPLPRKYRSYTYKGTTGALVREETEAAPTPSPLTAEQKAQLKQYVDERKQAIEADRRAHGDESSDEDKKFN